MPKMPVMSVRRQKQCGENRQDVEIAVGLLATTETNLLLSR